MMSSGRAEHRGHQLAHVPELLSSNILGTSADQWLEAPMVQWGSWNREGRLFGVERWDGGRELRKVGTLTRCSLARWLSVSLRREPREPVAV